jgi:hypothetical protein
MSQRYSFQGTCQARRILLKGVVVGFEKAGALRLILLTESSGEQK